MHFEISKKILPTEIASDSISSEDLQPVEEMK